MRADAADKGADRRNADDAARLVFGVRVHPEDPALLQQAPKSDQWIRRLVGRTEVVVEAREVLSTLSVVAEDLDSFVLPKVFLSVQGDIIDDGVGDRRAVVALIQQRQDLRAQFVQIGVLESDVRTNGARRAGRKGAKSGCATVGSPSSVLDALSIIPLYSH